MLVARGGDNDISGGGSSSSKEASFPSLFLVRSRMEGKRFGGTVITAKRLRGAREFHDKASLRRHYSCRFGDFATVGGEGRAAANFGEEECPVEKKKECGGMVEVKHTTLHAPAPAPASKGWCRKRNE
ncbi:uncharacterized protein HKW66_Vig0153310 [Vigna angularis]|uniref:Uncharacterized protein n=1 Tax=Phaseolus angularis TaxID=3914 RepID=A0A8T0JPH5_PHAAN|nr:uncharacterized protein HKW66_Vig0153310 [Vigna angularis]